MTRDSDPVGHEEGDLPEGLTRYLKVRMTDAELADLKDYARSVNRSLSEIARRRINQYKAPPPPVPAINVQTKVELGRQGNMLNQVVEHLNKSGGQFTSQDIAQFGGYMKAILLLLKDAQKQLIGMPVTPPSTLATTEASDEADS